MQFQVPQFIEVEDKIFGPLTFKQFVYFVGGAGLSFIMWRYMPIYVSGPFIIGVMGFAAALALGQWNGRPFIFGLEHGFYYLVGSKLYLWSHERKMKKKKDPVVLAKKEEVFIPGLSESKLHQLSWSLDIQEKLRGVGMQGTEGRASETLQTARADALAHVHTAKDALVR
jgi:hypothetical protein